MHAMYRIYGGHISEKHPKRGNGKNRGRKPAAEHMFLNRKYTFSGMTLVWGVYRMVCTARKVHAADVSMVMHAMYGMYGCHVSKPIPNGRNARFGVENLLQNTCF